MAVDRIVVVEVRVGVVVRRRDARRWTRYVVVRAVSVHGQRGRSSPQFVQDAISGRGG